MQNFSETMVLLGTALVSKNKGTDTVFPNSKAHGTNKRKVKSNLIKSVYLALKKFIDFPEWVGLPI